MSPSPSVNIGTLLAARWIVGAPLGMGENGEVYEAEEAQGGRLCAVKILNASFRRGGPAWSAFQNEVRAVSALSAEGIARVYDLGIDGKLHRPFIAGERVMFPALSRYVAERGPLDPRIVQQAFATIARALDQMHGAGIAHGAIKPQNVFLSAENPTWARLSDYGLARLKAAIDPNHTALGWTPPELSRGGVPEPAGDRFALSLVAFFALTGMPWLSALTAAGSSRDGQWGTLTTPASVRARELGGFLDPAFDPWFRAALAGNPASRYATAGEMAQALSSIVESLGTAATEGPHSGPGVVSAVARPLVFRRDLPQPVPPPAAPLGSTLQIAPPEAQPLPSVAHPYSPTVRAMPAMMAPNAHPSPAPAAPQYEAHRGQAADGAPTAAGYGAPPTPYAPAHAQYAQPDPYGVTAADQPNPFPHGTGFPQTPTVSLPPPKPQASRAALIGLFVAAFVLLVGLALGAIVFLRRAHDDAPSSAASASVAPAPEAPTQAAPAASLVTTEAPGTLPTSTNVPPPPPGGVQKKAAAPPAPAEPAEPAPKPAAAPTSKAIASAKPAASAKAAPTSKPAATAKPTATPKPTATATAAKPPAKSKGGKNCSTFLGCK